MHLPHGLPPARRVVPDVQEPLGILREEEVEQEHAGVPPVYVGDLLGVGHRDDLGVSAPAAHRAQQLTESGRGPDRIHVRGGVRLDHDDAVEAGRTAVGTAGLVRVETAGSEQDRLEYRYRVNVVEGVKCVTDRVDLLVEIRTQVTDRFRAALDRDVFRLVRIGRHRSGVRLRHQEKVTPRIRIDEIHLRLGKIWIDDAHGCVPLFGVTDRSLSLVNF